MSSEQLDFSTSVARSLSAENESALELWGPISEEYNRSGPEAAKEYLEAERQRIVERVETLLSQIEGD